MPNLVANTLGDRARIGEDGHGVGFLTCCNFGYVDLAYNLFLSLKRINLERHLLIVCSDSDACIYLTQRGVDCLLLPSNNDPDYAGYESPADFAQHLQFRAFALGQAMQGETDVFCIDGDIVFFNNPLFTMQTHFAAQIDDPVDDGTSGYLNCGCMLIRPDAVTRNVFDYEQMAPLIGTDDMVAVNARVREMSVEVTKLPRNNYPNGSYWLKHYRFKQLPDSVKLVHFNYINGKYYKIRCMREHNCWYLSTGDELPLN